MRRSIGSPDPGNETQTDAGSGLLGAGQTNSSFRFAGNIKRRGGSGAASPATHFAAAAILAGVALAIVGLDLTGDAGEAGLAGAGVAALPSVGARGFVLARLVIGAVVQVCDSVRGKQQQQQEEGDKQRHLYELGE